MIELVVSALVRPGRLSLILARLEGAAARIRPHPDCLNFSVAVGKEKLRLPDRGADTLHILLAWRSRSSFETYRDLPDVVRFLSDLVGHFAVLTVHGPIDCCNERACDPVPGDQDCDRARA